MVEAALVIPVLVMLTMMVIEGGLLFWNISYAQTSSASGARTGVTQAREINYQLTIRDAVTASLRNVTATPLTLIVYKADPATGRPTGMSPAGNDFSLCATDCYVFDWNPGTRTFVQQSGRAWLPTDQEACGPLTSTDYLGVQVRLLYDGPTKMIMKARPISADTMMRLEPVPVTAGQDCKP